MKTSILIRRFLRLTKMVRPHSGLLSCSILCGIAGHLASIGLMGFAAYAASRIIAGNALPLLEIFAAVGCGLVRGVLRYGEHYFGHDIAFRLLFDIRRKIFAAVNRLAPAKLLDRKSGDISAAVISDVEYVETFFAHTLAPIIIGTIVPLIMLGIFASINIIFAFVMLPFYLLTGLVIPVLSFRFSSEAGEDYRHKLSGLNSSLTENLQGLRELMLFGRDQQRLSQVLKDAGDCNSSYRRMRLNEGFLAAAVEVIIIAAAASVIAAGISVGDSAAEAAQLVPAVVLALTSFGPLISLMFLSNSLINTSAAAGRIFALLDEEPAVSNTAGPELISGFKIEYPPSIEDVGFCYPGSSRKIIDGRSIRFQPGRITSLKAPSGTGKSTILYLLMRFFDPDSGRVALNNENLKDYELDELRERISYFTQETVVFNVSVAENIRMADQNAGDEEVIEAARRAGIHDFIMSLPDGYETTAGEGGSRFSSGERQRIGLARIFLQNNDVILLDEPVSNLDAENEKLIMDNLRAELSGKTVILVSHRPTVNAIAGDVVEL